MRRRDRHSAIVIAEDVNSFGPFPDSGVTKGSQRDTCPWAQQAMRRKLTSPKIFYD